MLSASSGRVESFPGTFGIPSTSPLLSPKGEVTPLTAAILNDVLEEIGEGAFARCALVRIDIPPSVREIDAAAFVVGAWWIE